LTTDGWTSANHDQYITLTVQWLTEKFEENDYVLATQKIEGTCSAESIVGMIKNVLRY
jgi:hypothetical protein